MPARDRPVVGGTLGARIARRLHQPAEPVEMPPPAPHWSGRNGMRLLALRLFGLRPRRGRKLLRDQRGTTAIEFGILAIPFFVIVGAILETAVVFLASQILDSAVQDASRLILTGQAQNASYTLDDFKGAVCDHLYGMFNCDNLQIRVNTVTDFASATTTPPIDPSDPTQWKLVPAFQPGTGSSIVMVQVYYKWPTILNFAGLDLASYSDGTRLLGAVRVFENEPFTS
jgi:Flp pilus assembly protein TadG